MSEPTEAAYEATALAYDKAVNAALGNPPGTALGPHGRAWLLANPAFRAALDTLWPIAVSEGRRQAVEEVERPDSMLCDCPPRDENPATNPDTGAAMDHHCDCAAVEAAATMLRSYSATRHGQQCIHGTSMDEFYDGTDDA